MRSVLVCAPGPPEHDRESGAQRLLDFLRFFCDSSFQVHFATEWDSRDSPYLRAVREIGVTTCCGGMAGLDRALRLDLVIIHFWKLAERWMPKMRSFWPGTRIVVDSVDLHFLRSSRMAYQGGGEGPGLLDPELSFEMVRELNCYAAADAVWAVSEKEAGLIDDFLGCLGHAHCVPDAEEGRVSAIPWSERKGVLFLGNFKHPPNLAAVEFLCRRIAPLLPQGLLMDHPLTIVGNAMPAEIAAMAAGNPAIRAVGWVPSVVPYLHNSRISVVPLLFGAGTKRKLIQSLAAGTPAVTTWIGAEGLDLRDDEHVLIANDPEGFARSVARLLSDCGLWSRLARSGREKILELHSSDAVRRRLDEAVGKVLAASASRLPLAAAAQSLQSSWLKQQYDQLVDRIVKAIADVVPPDGMVAMVSKGDERLLQVPGRRICHFASDSQGTYLGYYPATGEACVARLRELCSRGTSFLAIPAPYLWWLQSYPELGEYLRENGRPLLRLEDTILIFEVKASDSASGPIRESGDKRW